MQKHYLPQTVYAATQERLSYLFSEFENIYVSFSGGKDSGLLLNLVLQFRDTYYPDRTVGLFHQDFEAQYSLTTEYVTRTFERLSGAVDPYWVCLPMATRTAVGNFETHWYPWDDEKEEAWVRPMPEAPYVINLACPFPHYRYRMPQEDLAKQFGRFYREKHGGGKTVCLLGLRAEESLYRYSGFLNKQNGYGDQCWISQSFKDVFCASPIYDWSVSDVWTANYRFGYDYNHLYDLYYKAGLKPSQMRVASPFNEWSRDSLNLYRVIDPEIWVKLVGRVRGANFAAIYSKTKALGWRNVTLPPGHTWESYTKFLLSTLPPTLRRGYIKKFQTSIRFWHITGGGLSAEAIQELQEKGYRILCNGVSNYTLDHKTRVIFVGQIPDHTDDILATKDIPSWKRMCLCILRNDHNCRSMGFGLSREEQKRIKFIKEQYGELLNGT